MSERKIKSALISVYHKEGLDDIVSLLNQLKVRIFSTGGTWDHITRTGIRAEKVEDLTTYPSILGGRVKTLHPSVFGGILARRENSGDMEQMDRYGIPEIDLVIVDLYPFGETVRNTDDEAEITEKIDIGGISLIRAAAKNFRDVVVISSRDQYSRLLELDGVELVFTPEALRAAARDAMKLKTGARGLRTIIERVLLDVMYEIPSHPEVVKCVVNADCITRNASPLLLNGDGQPIAWGEIPNKQSA